MHGAQHKRSFLISCMSGRNAKAALQSPPSRPDPGLRGGGTQSLLHQGGRGAVHHPVGRQPADPGAGGAPERPPVRAPAPGAGADRAGPRPAARRRRAAGAAAGGHGPHAHRRRRATAHGDDHQRLCLALAHSPPARLHGLQPDVDVRISATYKAINLERSLVDVAVRLCEAADAPEGAVRLFGEELFPGLQSGLARRRAPSPAHAAGPAAPRAAAHARGGRLARLGHLAGGAGMRRPEARRLAQVRRLRADDRGGAERPGRRHGDRSPRQRTAAGGPAGGAIQQERRRRARLLRHLLVADGRRDRTCRRSSTG